jgi:hypothetical protein
MLIANCGQRPSRSSLGFGGIGPPSVAPRFTGQLTSPLPKCSKRRRRPGPGCVQLSSTSSRGMAVTFSKRVERTSRHFCGRPFFKSRCPPRRLARRKRPSHCPRARPAMEEAARAQLLDQARSNLASKPPQTDAPRNATRSLSWRVSPERLKLAEPVRKSR